MQVVTRYKGSFFAPNRVLSEEIGKIATGLQLDIYSLVQSRNRPAVYVIAAANLRKIAAFDRLARLVIGELGLAPHLHAARLGAFAAFAGAR